MDSVLALSVPFNPLFVIPQKTEATGLAAMTEGGLRESERENECACVRVFTLLVSSQEPEACVAQLEMLNIQSSPGLRGESGAEI